MDFSGLSECDSVILRYHIVREMTNTLHLFPSTRDKGYSLIRRGTSESSSKTLRSFTTTSRSRLSCSSARAMRAAIHPSATRLRKAISVPVFARSLSAVHGIEVVWLARAFFITRDDSL